MPAHTKIIATIGPKSRDFSTIMKMAKAGMDICRLNFSHGDYKFFTSLIKTIRRVSKKIGKHIDVLQDLQGPKMRLGVFHEKILTKGETVVLGGKNIPVDFKNFSKLVRRNDPVFIADGSVELRAISVEKNEVKCQVLSGGLIKSRKGINLPNMKSRKRKNPLAKKDIRDLAFGLKHKVDYVALSFVSDAFDIKFLRSLILKKTKKHRPKIIAKIERKEAIKNIDAIVSIADAMMVARGDLGVEIPAEMVPLIQKKIVHLGNKHGKPVIVATQILSSMVTNKKPTRAEISDAANAVFDRADGLMLSDETAVGKYPVEAVAVLAKVRKAAEREIKKNPHLFQSDILKSW